MRLWVPGDQRRPDPPVPDSDDRVPILIATGAWVLALVGAGVGYGALADQDRGWWLWTAAAGIALGAYGWSYVTRRRRAARAAAGQAEPGQPE
jgi:hypothetical protein